MIRGLWTKLSVEKPNSCRIQVSEIKAKHRGSSLGANIISGTGGKVKNACSV